MTESLEFIRYCLDLKEGPAILYYDDSYYPIRSSENITDLTDLGSLASVETVARWLAYNQFWLSIESITPISQETKKYYTYHASLANRQWFRSWSPL